MTHYWSEPFGTPVAIAADADMWCLSCYETSMEPEAWAILMEGTYDELDERYPKDGEGNPIHVLLAGQNDEDLHGQYCGNPECRTELCPNGWECDCYDTTKEED